MPELLAAVCAGQAPDGRSQVRLILRSAMTREIISPAHIHKPTTYYSHAIVIDDTIYLAGQAPHDTDGSVWPPDDPAGQVRRVYENMLAVLRAAGVGYSEVVRMSVLVRRPDILPLVYNIAAEYLGSHRPAMTTAVVSGLAGADYLLEMDAIAVRRREGE